MDPVRTAAQAMVKRPLRPEEYQRRMVEYNTAMAPVIEALSAIMVLSPLRYIVLPSGEVQKVDSQEIVNARLVVEEVSKLIARQIFGQDMVLSLGGI